VSTRARGSALFSELALLTASFASGLLAVGLVYAALGIADQRWAQIIGTPIIVALAAATYGLIDRQTPATPHSPPADSTAGLSEAALPPKADGWTTARVGATHLFYAVAGSMLLSAALHLLGLTVEEQEKVREYTTRGSDGSFHPALYFLAPVALLAAPLTEELLFRRFFFSRVLISVSTRWAYAASAIMFAAIHWNPSGFPVYIWLGLVFAHAYHRTGRISCAILVHFGNNLITLAVLLLSR
jgi:membrane protease YdiL (CAAX protease family)